MYRLELVNPTSQANKVIKKGIDKMIKELWDNAQIEKHSNEYNAKIQDVIDSWKTASSVEIAGRHVDCLLHSYDGYTPFTRTTYIAGVRVGKCLVRAYSHEASDEDKLKSRSVEQYLNATAYAVAYHAKLNINRAKELIQALFDNEKLSYMNIVIERDKRLSNGLVKSEELYSELCWAVLGD